MTVSLITQRVFFDTTDISVAMSDFRSGTYAMVSTSSKYLYVGSSTPFNNLWLELSTVAGASAGAPTVQIWWGSQWTSAVDVIDGTSGMTASGRVSWATDILKGWNLEQYSTTVGLAGTAIYNRYWLRLNWATSFNATLAFVGQKFSSDSILQSMYPDLLQSTILAGYKAGKTSWDEQHFMAAEAIIRDLRKRNMISFAGQILDWSVFEEASAHKVAEIAYMAFGTAYREHANEARKRYEAEMASRLLVLDENRDGHVQFEETKSSQGWIGR
jgi:hypothetical protein